MKIIIVSLPLILYILLWLILAILNGQVHIAPGIIHRFEGSPLIAYLSIYISLIFATLILNFSVIIKRIMKRKEKHLSSSFWLHSFFVIFSLFFLGWVIGYFASIILPFSPTLSFALLYMLSSFTDVAIMTIVGVLFFLIATFGIVDACEEDGGKRLDNIDKVFVILPLVFFFLPILSLLLYVLFGRFLIGELFALSTSMIFIMLILNIGFSVKRNIRRRIKTLSLLFFINISSAVLFLAILFSFVQPFIQIIFRSDFPPSLIAFIRILSSIPPDLFLSLPYIAIMLPLTAVAIFGFLDLHKNKKLE